MGSRVRVLDRLQFVRGVVLWIASGAVALVIGILGATGVLFASRAPGVLMAIGGAAWLMIGAAGAIRLRRN